MPTTSKPRAARQAATQVPSFPKPQTVILCSFSVTEFLTTMDICVIQDCTMCASYRRHPPGEELVRLTPNGFFRNQSIREICGRHSERASRQNSLLRTGVPANGRLPLAVAWSLAAKTPFPASIPGLPVREREKLPFHET